jgi:hypothetical protein
MRFREHWEAALTLLTGENFEEENMSEYFEYGCENREQYLEQLADEYGVPIDIVMAAADLLGPDEDFDGLVSALEDYR